jgi:hypothetical protein
MENENRSFALHSSGGEVKQMKNNFFKAIFSLIK